MDPVIRDATLRRLASEKGLPLDLVEKDYILGWVLYGASKRSIHDL